MPRVGAVYALRYSQGFWGDTRARISYGQGIEEPTIFESFDADPCNPGNPNLRPERSRTVNVGLDQYFSADRFRISATFFANEFRDLIDQQVGPPNPICFSGNEMLFFNIDRARARGLNWSGEAHLNHWLALKGNYSYDDTRVLKTVATAPSVEQPGNHLLRRPVNSGNLWLNATFRCVNFNLAGYFTGVRTDSDFDGLGFTRNPGYARFDFATSYNFARGISFYGRVTNLLDKQYQEAIGFPALGPRLSSRPKLPLLRPQLMLAVRLLVPCSGGSSDTPACSAGALVGTAFRGRPLFLSDILGEPKCRRHMRRER